MSGIDYELIPIRKLKLDVEMSPCNWTGLLGDINDGIYDTLTVPFVFLPTRARCFRYTAPTTYTYSLSLSLSARPVGISII